MEKSFVKGFEKIAKSKDLTDHMVDANLGGSRLLGNKAKKEKLKKLRRAERALVKNQGEKIKNDSLVGAGLGAVAGLAKFKKSPLAALIGAGAGGFGGAAVGTVRGSRGSDAAKIRKKHLGTSDLKKIRKEYFNRK
jgi:hypothetical protein